MTPVGASQPWVRTTSFTEWYSNNYDQRDQNDKFVALVNRINFGVDTRMPKWTLGVQARIDTQNLFDTDLSTPLCDRNDNGQVDGAERAECVFTNDGRIERFSVRAEFWKAKVVAGDFNVNLGRGLGLSVRKIDEIGVDATIKGGRVDLRFKPVEFTLLAGVANRQNSDFATRQLISDPGWRASPRCDKRKGVYTLHPIGNPLWSTCGDVVVGGRVEGKLPGKVRLAANYGYIGFGEKLSSAYEESVHSVGGDLARARIAKTWDLFVGGALLLRNPDLANDPVLSQVAYRGMALYTANQFSFGTRAHATSVLFEAKYYKDYLLALTAQRLQYAGAPTLEREDQQVPGSANSAGGRVRIDHTLGDLGLTIFGNLSGYAFAEEVQENMFNPEEGFWMVHPYAGLLWRKPGTGLGVQASGGYRFERHIQAPSPGEAPFRRKFPHGEFYVTIPVGKGGGFSHSVSVRGEARWETKQVSSVGEDNRFVFGNVILGYAMAPFVNLSFIGGFSSEFPGIEGEPQLQDKACAIEESCLRKPHLWPGAEVRVNFLANSYVRVFGGRQVGGRVCVNGSCRFLPDFEGVRAELVFGF